MSLIVILLAINIVYIPMDIRCTCDHTCSSGEACTSNVHGYVYNIDGQQNHNK